MGVREDSLLAHPSSHPVGSPSPGCRPPPRTQTSHKTVATSAASFVCGEGLAAPAETPLLPSHCHPTAKHRHLTPGAAPQTWLHASHLWGHVLALSCGPSTRPQPLQVPCRLTLGFSPHQMKKLARRQQQQQDQQNTQRLSSGKGPYAILAGAGFPCHSLQLPSFLGHPCGLPEALASPGEWGLAPELSPRSCDRSALLQPGPAYGRWC